MDTSNTTDEKGDEFSVFEESLAELESNQALLAQKTYMLMKLTAVMCDYLISKDPQFETHLNNFNEEMEEAIQGAPK